MMAVLIEQPGDDRTARQNNDPNPTSLPEDER
jgi:hypothetical protein